MTHDYSFDADRLNTGETTFGFSQWEEGKVVAMIHRVGTTGAMRGDLFEIRVQASDEVTQDGGEAIEVSGIGLVSAAEKSLETLWTVKIKRTDLEQFLSHTKSP